jgi:hypothetical protein
VGLAGHTAAGAGLFRLDRRGHDPAYGFHSIRTEPEHFAHFFGCRYRVRDGVRAHILIIEALIFWCPEPFLTITALGTSPAPRYGTSRLVWSRLPLPGGKGIYQQLSRTAPAKAVISAILRVANHTDEAPSADSQKPFINDNILYRLVKGLKRGRFRRCLPTSKAKHRSAIEFQLQHAAAVMNVDQRLHAAMAAYAVLVAAGRAHAGRQDPARSLDLPRRPGAADDHRS